MRHKWVKWSRAKQQLVPSFPVEAYGGEDVLASRDFTAMETPYWTFTNVADRYFDDEYICAVTQNKSFFVEHWNIE